MMAKIRVFDPKGRAGFIPESQLKDALAQGFKLADQHTAQSQQVELPSLTSRLWEGLTVPERMSREGLGKLAGMVPGVEPTGNLSRDIILNIPKISAETIAE